MYLDFTENTIFKRIGIIFSAEPIGNIISRFIIKSRLKNQRKKIICAGTFLLAIIFSTFGTIFYIDDINLLTFTAISLLFTCGIVKISLFSKYFLKILFKYSKIRLYL
jgi:hypothetical protein